MFYLCFNYVILFIHNKLPIDNHCAGRTFKLKYLLFAKLILPAPVDVSFWYCSASLDSWCLHFPILLSLEQHENNSCKTVLHMELIAK